MNIQEKVYFFPIPKEIKANGKDLDCQKIEVSIDGKRFYAIFQLGTNSKIRLNSDSKLTHFRIIGLKEIMDEKIAYPIQDMHHPHESTIEYIRTKLHEAYPDNRGLLKRLFSKPRISVTMSQIIFNIC